MKLIFAGTPPFAALALQALVKAGFQIGLVLTQPDRPAGRGLRLHPSAVNVCAGVHGLPVAQPPNLKDPEVHEMLRAIDADAMIVAAYGLLLPAAVLNVPPRGCLNIHASLLPRWRGAAPIQRALLAGDDETGITIMQMDAGLDTGPILLQERVAIAADDTARTLHDKLAQLGAGAIVQALRTATMARTQDAANATYAEKITKAEATIRRRVRRPRGVELRSKSGARPASRTAEHRQGLSWMPARTASSSRPARMRSESSNCKKRVRSG